MSRKKQEEKLDALIFIDTNIFLDFYRIRKGSVSLKYLEEINNHKDIIITSNQVEMEFKKNRQSVLLDSIGDLKKNSIPGVNAPVILSDVKAVDMMSKHVREVQKQQKKIKEKIEKILFRPQYNDKVYKELQKLFNQKSEFNLDRSKEERIEVRKLAEKRFLLGYPPRKKSDNSIGDAVNWEWVIMCASKSNKDIIIVTRDSDYGKTYQDTVYLNDWLAQEFKQRIGNKRKIFITDKLSQAFKMVEIPVTEDMIKEENNVIDLSQALYMNKIYQENLRESVRRFHESMTNPSLQDTMKRLSDTIARINRLRGNDQS